jgi:hypothetical protein
MNTEDRIGAAPSGDPSPSAHRPHRWMTLYMPLICWRLNSKDVFEMLSKRAVTTGQRDPDPVRQGCA